MSSWHCFVEERAEQMRMLRRGAAALVLIAPRRAFLAWGQHALATQRALAKLLRVVEPKAPAARARVQHAVRHGRRDGEDAH